MIGWSRISGLVAGAMLLIYSGSALAQEFEIWVSDAGNLDQGPWQILKYDQNGANPQVFTNVALGWPQDIVFLEEAGEVLVSNITSGQINRYDINTGIYLGPFASGIGQPTRMKISHDGLLYVLQWAGTGRVLRFQLDGTPLGDFTQFGVANSIGLDWDNQGNLLVSSYNTQTIHKFDSLGAYLGIFTTGNMQGPTNIWFDDGGGLIVLDWNGGDIRRFGPTGTFLGNWAAGLGQPEGVDFLPNGNVLVGNGSTGAVKEFTPTGAFVKDYITSGLGGLIKPNAVVIRHLASGFKINPGINDAWVNADAPFQGMFITYFPDLNLVFVAWFTFDSQAPAGSSMATFGAIDQRWVTGAGTVNGNRVEINMENTSGGIFNGANPMPTQDTSYGTMVLEFTDCTEASVTYSFPTAGQTGGFTIKRVVDSNVALCESLDSFDP